MSLLRARHKQHFAWSGRSVLVVGADGQALDDRHGFFLEATRFLSRLELWADGRMLDCFSVANGPPDRLLAYHAVRWTPGQLSPALFLEADYRVDEWLDIELRFTNYGPSAAESVELELRAAADFADLNEVEDGKRYECAEVEPEWSDERQELRFAYRHPKLDRASVLRVLASPATAAMRGDALMIPVTVEPHTPMTIRLRVEPEIDGRRHSPDEPEVARRAGVLSRTREAIREEAPRLICTNPDVTAAWDTAVEDLASLPMGLEGAPAALAAGIPIYQHFFGRDTLTAGWQAALATRTPLRDALRLNAALQGKVVDDWRDEEPGKMIHQVRSGPLSVLGFDPVARYYGDYATAPDFLVMLAQYLAWTGDRDEVRRLLPAARAAIAWLESYADADADGFIEYKTRSPKGVKNQGWKDAGDSIVDERGEIPANPLATSELQAYWYAALQLMAGVFAATGHARDAWRCYRESRALAHRFNERFWMEDEGAYALALRADGSQVRSVGSNDAHLLAAGIVPRERADRVLRRLMAPDMFSGWGIRTLSSEHPAYSPFSYHRGSVWAVESGTAAFGFARYGAWDELHRLAGATFACAKLFEEHRLPEVISGLPRDDAHPHPGVYPAANAPQAWSASTIVMTVQALLGMNPVAQAGFVLLDPHLPEWLPHLELRGVRVADTVFDVECRRRQDGSTEFDVKRHHGRLRVVRQAPPQARESTLGRAWDVVRSFPG
jgi:glycogen debranching enzyme